MINQLQLVTKEITGIKEAIPIPSNKAAIKMIVKSTSL